MLSHFCAPPGFQCSNVDNFCVSYENCWQAKSFCAIMYCSFKIILERLFLLLFIINSIVHSSVFGKFDDSDISKGVHDEIRILWCELEVINYQMLGDVWWIGLC